jgi:CRP-like cAMP-binding protein
VATDSPDLIPEQLALLRERGRARSFAKGEVVFHEGDPGETLHVIESGRFMVEVTSQAGEKVALTVFGPGELFGELALILDHAHRTATVVALEAGRTRAIHRDDLDELRRSDPRLTEALLRIVAAKVGRYTAHLLEALHEPAERRVLRRLRELHEQYGSDIPLRQEDLAALAGTSRATANQVLRREAERGVLRLGRARVEVVDPEALRRLTED